MGLIPAFLQFAMDKQYKKRLTVVCCLPACSLTLICACLTLYCLNNYFSKAATVSNVSQLLWEPLRSSQALTVYKSTDQLGYRAGCCSVGERLQATVLSQTLLQPVSPTLWRGSVCVTATLTTLTDLNIQLDNSIEFFLGAVPPCSHMYHFSFVPQKTMKEYVHGAIQH